MRHQSGCSARARKTYPELPIVDDASVVIDDKGIDIVSVATYDDAHYEQVTRALRCGKHVFVEKPLCLRVAEYRSIQDLLRARPKQRLSSNTILRLSPRFQKLRQLIATDALGRLFNIEGDYLYGRLEKLTQGWRGRIPNYSVTLGGAIHLIDLMLWLTGDRVRAVSAVGNAISGSGSTFAGEDIVTAVLAFESGLIGKVSANFGCVCPHFHKLAVYGTKGTFENSYESGLLWRSRDSTTGPELIRAAYPGIDKGDLIPSFVDAVLGRGQARVTEADVLAAMSVGLAIDRSLSEGRMVTIAEISAS